MKTKLYDFFISYSSKDKSWVDEFLKHVKSEICHPIENRGLRIYRDQDEMRAGFTWLAQAHQALQNSDFVLAVFSRNFIESIPCHKEIAVKEIEDPLASRGLILPIKIDDTSIPKDLAGNRVFRDFSRAIDFNSDDFTHVFSELKADIINILKAVNEELPAPTTQQAINAISNQPTIRIERIETTRAIITPRYEEGASSNARSESSSEPPVASIAIGLLTAQQEAIIAGEVKKK